MKKNPSKSSTNRKIYDIYYKIYNSVLGSTKPYKSHWRNIIKQILFLN